MRSAIILASLLLASTAAAVPLEFNHQGRLMDQTGLPLDGAQEVVFHLYDAPSGGTELWTETHPALEFDSGYYSVLLGELTSLDTAFFDGNSLFMALSVNGGAPTPTRIALVSVPYAVRADTAVNLSGGVVDATEVRVNGTPVIDGTGAISGAVNYSDLVGVPTVTIDDLPCTTDQVPVFDGSVWACGDMLGAHEHDTAHLTSGTLTIDRLPIGTSNSDVAAGDHIHSEIGANTARLDALEGALTASGTEVELVGGITIGDVAGDSCSPDGTLRFTGNSLDLCLGGAWLTAVQGLGQDSGAPGDSCKHILDEGAAQGDGLYWIDPNGGNSSDAYQVYCDMTTASGGWTMALNLDTSDGHVMWWANPLWTDAETYGDVSSPFDEDHKSEAFMNLDGTSEIMLVIHEQGSVVGWKSFAKAGTDAMTTYMQGADNTALGSSVTGEDVSSIWSGERLVRTSTTLRANNCVNGSCTTGNGGSPDGDRISSPQAGPANNNGGGLGNWHDMNYCCSGASYGSGKACNGSTFRTTSEAQAGWAYSSQNGTFGSDSFGPMTGVERDGTCTDAAWAEANGYDYDYTVYVR